MKKNYKPNEVSQKEGQDQSKKLYRSITEQAKRLEDSKTCVHKVGDLFTPYLHIQRKKLRDYCERLIFLDPVLFGHKTEELLWRKCYYDVIVTAKKLKKQEYTPEEICKIETHINGGIGYYHHLISKLQVEYNLNLHGYVDFMMCYEDKLKSNEKVKVEGLVEWANQCVHHCLIYLGDLSRYKLEIYPNWDSSLSIRYYSQASFFLPDYGMPHNQLGTLASNQNRNLDAVYHYMRCLACKISFEGTENNLQRMFEKNSQYLEKLPNDNHNSDCIIQLEKVDHIKQFLARFLLLIDIWYFNKTVPHIYSLCHQTYIDLEECLTYCKPVASESEDAQTELDSDETESSSQSYLSNEEMFKIVVICLLCIMKLQKIQSSHLSTAVAFTLAVYSQLIQNAMSHIQQSVLSFPLPQEKTEKKLKLKLKKLRRRRKSLGDSEDSEHSDEELVNNSDSSSDESVDFDNDLALASSSEDEADDKGCESVRNAPVNNTELNQKGEEKSEEKLNIDNQKITQDMIKKSKCMDTNDMLEIITEEGLLRGIRIISEWLRSDVEVLQSCSKTSKSLLRQITNFLNFININMSKLKLEDSKTNNLNLPTNFEKISLPEDITLKGIEILSSCQKDIVWNFLKNQELSVKQQYVIRLMKIMAFGKYLTTVKETNITYDDTNKMFICNMEEDESDKISSVTFEDLEKQNSENEHNITNNNLKHETKDESKGQLVKMKHMGQLWLAAEVRALESRVKGKTSLSPYLVLDADALIKYTYMAKNLVNSRKFIIIVPSAVVSALDDLKREKIEARDAIRWLEYQFHQGNRFFRAQRPHERAPLPFIKYPKKKDKQAFIYIQVIECCHYLAQQQNRVSNLVTLLIGNQNALTNAENKEISYIGLAQSAGVQLESITQFYTKWKKTSKGKR